MAPDRGFLEWKDIAGNFLRTSSWVQAGASLVALYAACQNGSNGNLLYATSGAPVVGTVSPTDAMFPLAVDLATFNFQTAPGSTCQLVVPAPKQGLFLPGAQVVDATAGLSAAIILASIGLLADSSGNLATAFAGGSKVSRRTDQVVG